MKNIDIKKGKVFATIIIVLLLVVGGLFSSWIVIEPGHTGVVVTMGKVEENVLQEGFHFKVPFIQEVVKIDNRIVKLEVQTEAFSKDLQTVTTNLAINYRVDTKKSYSIYKNVGSKCKNKS